MQPPFRYSEEIQKGQIHSATRKRDSKTETGVFIPLFGRQIRNKTRCLEFKASAIRGSICTEQTSLCNHVDSRLKIIGSIQICALPNRRSTNAATRELELGSVNESTSKGCSTVGACMFLVESVRRNCAQGQCIQ